MTRVLVIGDVHLADRPPSIRTSTYTEDILEKLQFAVNTAVEREVEAIVLAGDVFHIKTPTRNSHHLVQRTAEVLTTGKIRVLIVPGNHDLSGDRLDSLSRQPLGTLTKIQDIDLLIGPDTEGLPLFGLPYLQDWAADLPKWMGQWVKWSTAQKLEEFEFFPLMVTHAPIFPKGEEPPYDFVGADDWAALMQNGDCLYGHIHDPHGVYHPSTEGNSWFCNNGAISRGSLHEKTLKRKPAVTIWDSSKSDGARFETIPVPHRPAEAVFRLHEREDVDEKTNRVEEFLASIGSTTLNGLSIEEVRHHAQEQGLSERTRTLISELLEVVA